MNDNNPSFKNRGGASGLLNALCHSCRGLGFAFRFEVAFRQELLLSLMLLPLAFVIGDSPLERLLLCASLVLVLIAELFNSAIEALADAITLDHDVLIGRAKDLASAAVMVSVLLCATSWAIVLFGFLRR